MKINFGGDVPKNRCFTSVIGYNHNVKDLCSGWLIDLYVNPLRIDRQKKMVPDGTGDVVEIEVLKHVWVESVKTLSSTLKYPDAVLFASELSKEWTEHHSLSPIIIDFSDTCHVYSAKEEVKQLKSIVAVDGNTLFWGGYSRNEDVFYMFSKMPDWWNYIFEIWDLKEEDYIRGVFNRKHMHSILCALQRLCI